jgi:hypothetical protein
MTRSHRCYCIACALLSFALAALLLAAAPAAWSAPPAPPAKPVSFINDVAPVLKESCFGCHGAKNPKGKLDMTRYAALRKGGTKTDASLFPVVALWKVFAPFDTYLHKLVFFVEVPRHIYKYPCRKTKIFTIFDGKNLFYLSALFYGCDL